MGQKCLYGKTEGIVRSLFIPSLVYIKNAEIITFMDAGTM
jgi:hypothetical protein